MIFMATALTIIQLSSAYLRYLPFSRELSEEKFSRLRKSFLLWSLVGLTINLCIFADGVTYRAFKLSFSFNWLPYVLISLAIIRGKLPQHCFVLGMQMLWVFMLHALGGMGVALIYGNMAEEFLPLQASIYLGLFTVLLPVERKFFITLLPSAKLFEDRSLRWYISLLPLIIFIGTTITITEATFLPTWQEKLSHLTIPVVFLLIYRSLSIATQHVEERQLREQNNRQLQRQTESMSAHNALMEKSQSEVAALRRDLGKNYLEIEKLLTAGKNFEAMEFIRRQTKLLDSTRVKTFCTSPLINAALSIYLSRAEKLGIKVRHKIDLPAKTSTDESDVAVLVSNLLENAIEASLKQKNPSAREISLIMRNAGGQNVLEIENRFDLPIKIGENGLPYTSEIGHGLGMMSLEAFAKKYDAFFDFEHTNGFVRLSIYWND